MMTNEISVKSMSDAQIMAAIGQTVDTNRPILSRLQINRDAEDDEGTGGSCRTRTVTGG